MGAVAGQRLAVVGGRGELGALSRLGHRVVAYASPGHAGAGPVRQLEEALRSGSFAVVIILTRWIGHSTFWHIRKVCKATHTKLIVWPGGVSSLAAELFAQPPEPDVSSSPSANHQSAPERRTHARGF